MEYRVWARWLGIAFGAFALSRLAASAQAAELVQGRCHMDVCEWFSVEDKDLVFSNKVGALFKVATKEWWSDHPNGSYDKKTPRHGGEVAIIYVFCSKTRPAILWRDDASGKWTGEVFSVGYPYGPSGADEEIYMEYLYVCHGIEVKSDKDYKRVGKKYHYPFRVDDDSHSIELDQVTDIATMSRRSWRRLSRCFLMEGENCHMRSQASAIAQWAALLRP